jgi:general secretion pathway protein D
MMNVSLRNALALLGSAALLLGCAAAKLHRDGLADIDHGNYESGVAQLSQAVQRDPDNMTYKLDLATRRDAAIQHLISSADALRSAGQLDAAADTYRRVLVINPIAQRALQGLEGVESDRRHLAMVGEAAKAFEHKDLDAADAILRTVLNEDSGYGPAVNLAAKINLARGPITVAPRLKTRNNAKVTLQFRDAPTKMVFEVLARQTGINFVLDKDVKSDSKTTIFVQEVPIEDAIDLVLDQNALARQILSANMVMIYPNTPAKQKDYEEQIVHTFYLTNALPKDVESMLKSMLGAKTLFVDERTNVVVMRDTPDTVRMAEKLVASIDVPEPEVLIAVEVVEIARSRLLDLGITPPTSITASATSVVGAAAAASTGGAGGLVLNDLTKQNANTIAITPVSISASALQTVGNTNTLASPRIRARNKEKAKILIGSRVPVITSSTALLTSGTASSSSVQYLDVGLTLEVQPTVYADGDVGIKVGLEVSSITNTVVVQGTQAYTIGTRNANTVLRLKDGETQVLAGLIQDSDTRTAAGIPGLSQIPVVGRLFGSNNTDREKNEIVLSITPHIIRTQARPAADATEFWYGTETRSRSAPFGSSGFTGAAADAPGAALGAGGASGGSAAAAGPGIPTVGPRPSVSQPVVPSAPSAARPAAPPGPPPHPTVTVDGPGEIAVGQEFDVTVNMSSDIGIARLRGQLRFDATALQLMSATAGELVPASAGSPTVDAKTGGAQLDVNAPEDLIQGEGSLMLLRFKALSPRPASALTAQVSAMAPSGSAMANAVSQPLSVVIKP